MHKLILKVFILIYALFFTTTSLALLPPYYESTKEITAILNNPKVIEKITSGRLINSITRTEAGYIISAGNCTLLIKIKYLPLPDGMVGAAVFELEPGELVCQPS